MGTVAVLPVKRLAAAKQRLDRVDRAEVMRSLVVSVLDALRHSTVVRVLVVTSDERVAALAREHGCGVVPEPGLLGHSAAAALGVEHAAALGARRVLLLAGDCPLLTGDAIDALLLEHDQPGVVILCDRHRTGTNSLLLEPPTVIRPAFGPGSRARHERLAATAGAWCIVDERPAFAFDVDTNADLAAVGRLTTA